MTSFCSWPIFTGLTAPCSAFGSLDPAAQALALQRDFQLEQNDVSAIADQMSNPENLVRELVCRFSPKWFLGWRDICRSTDERTTISAVLTKAAVGDTFLLIFTRYGMAADKLRLLS